jgi:two-component system copper resistance phosphate regulon response regulator CusR
MKILVIEDEPKTVAYLRKGLVERGYAVHVSRHGDEGLARARAGGYDLVLLDVMLPGSDGWTILSELRQIGHSTPVLFLTARDAIADRVRGLEMGADDYLVKPFDFSELLARIQSVLRRTTAAAADRLLVADLEIDLLHQRATRAGQRLELTPKEFALLVLLARHKGESVNRSVIAREVWDMHYEAETNVVDVHVRRLRCKVDEPFRLKLIHTVRGVGYVLEEQT